MTPSKTWTQEQDEEFLKMPVETGLPESPEAYRYREIHHVVTQMGGWANLRYWITRHAAEYFKTCENLEAKNTRLMQDVAPLVEAIDHVLKKCPHRVSQNEAADMSIEFQNLLREALAKFKQAQGMK